MAFAGVNTSSAVRSSVGPTPQRSLIAPRGLGTQPIRAHGQRRCNNKLRVVRSAAAEATAAPSKDISTSVDILHEAAANRSISPKGVFAAFRELEKKKLDPDGWEQKLGGNSSPGRRWRLIFTTGTKKTQEALKSGQGGGTYIPFNTVQRWDAEKHEEENGVYLGHIASLCFVGPWEMKARKLTFGIHRINCKLGPLKFGFNIGSNKDPKEGEKAKPDPFYQWVYVDDKICVARGRGGGLAMWARTSPVWELQAGVLYQA